MDYVTWSDLFLFFTLILTAISVYNGTKRKRPLVFPKAVTSLIHREEPLPVPSFFFMITKNRSLVKMGEGPPGKVRIGSKKQKRCGGFTPTPLTSFFVRKAKLSFRNFLAKKL